MRAVFLWKCVKQVTNGILDYSGESMSKTPMNFQIFEPDKFKIIFPEMLVLSFLLTVNTSFGNSYSSTSLLSSRTRLHELTGLP